MQYDALTLLTILNRFIFFCLRQYPVFVGGLSHRIVNSSSDIYPFK